MKFALIADKYETPNMQQPKSTPVAWLWATDATITATIAAENAENSSVFAFVFKKPASEHPLSASYTVPVMTAGDAAAGTQAVRDNVASLDIKHQVPITTNTNATFALKLLKTMLQPLP